VRSFDRHRALDEQDLPDGRPVVLPKNVSSEYVPRRICSSTGAVTPRGGFFATAAAIRSQSGRSFCVPPAAARISCEAP
jgi:hypothetical protein